MRTSSEPSVSATRAYIIDRIGVLVFERLEIQALCPLQAASSGPTTRDAHSLSPCPRYCATRELCRSCKEPQIEVELSQLTPLLARLLRNETPTCADWQSEPWRSVAQAMDEERAEWLRQAENENLS